MSCCQQRLGTSAKSLSRLHKISYSSRSSESFSPQIMNVRHFGQKGFSLMELLVAVGIIAVLAGMILPSLSGMRRSAAIAQCTANLRQVHALFLQDVQDNDFQVPPAYNDGLGYPVAGVPDKAGWLDYRWNDLTDNKKKSSIIEKVFGCPAQRKLRKLAANARTYSMNSLLANTYWNGGGRKPPINYYKFSQPSKSVIFMDGTYDGSPYNSAANGGNKMPEAVHEGKANFVFLDGHTEMIKLADIPKAPASPDTAATLGTPESIFWLGR